jgi:hypothetical protein
MSVTERINRKVGTGAIAPYVDQALHDGEKLQREARAAVASELERAARRLRRRPSRRRKTLRAFVVAAGVASAVFTAVTAYRRTAEA